MEFQRSRESIGALNGVEWCARGRRASRVSAGKHVLEESRDEFDSRQSDTTNFLRAVIAVAESDYTVVDGFKPAVGDGDPEDIASEVVEHLIAASGMLGMNDPVFLAQSGFRQ